MRNKITTALAVACGLAGLVFGLNFLLNPHAANGFGISPWPTGDAAGYFVVKAVRDIAYGLVVLVLLARGHRRTLGWVVLIDALIPLGDGIAVLTHGGSVTTALSIHFSAATLVLITAALLLTERTPREASSSAAGTDSSRTVTTGRP
jgi:hypothetical protein